MATQDVGSLGPQEWLFRIAQSAGSLTQDLLSLNSAYEATGDLEQIRSAHKAGYQNQNGALSSERHLKLLSKRHRAANGTARSSRQYFDHANDSELEDEIVDFLRRECSISNDGASSSRSVSPLSRWDNIRWSQTQTRESSPKADYDQFSNINEASYEGQLIQTNDLQDLKGNVFDHSVDQAISPVDHQSFFAGYPTDAVRKEIAAALASREADHFDTHLETPSAVDPALAVAEQQSAILNSRAARRIQLIASHLADIKLATKPSSVTLNSTISTTRPGLSSTASAAATAQRTLSGLDSAYNQLCHGDMDTAWDGFQAQGPYCLASHRPQQQQVPDSRAYETLERMQQNAETVATSTSAVRILQQITNKDRNGNEEKEKEEEEEPPLDFHCPWIGCHKHLENNYQYLRDANGKLEGFGCVHEGCDDVYIEEAEWREHVLSAHHGLVQRVKDVGNLVKRDDDDDVEKVFEGVWREV